ncbi:MAG: HDOD domain-containing protein [Pseudomonadales bacterium]|jgi:HD-like signal output (HDOD) protein|nr:HDOD domain-containing protein [Pseudomonadales bacterium]MDP6469968.1 HDOD domain-containing protein [Pseudomonadales bacterium]MDP6829135.1 HDOD domain-containing protein [Pseudomonadales bacterium]|tara:strand:- start:601 stop:1095 length:495 start_codon:yes stop_codon:yes gene_type:complete
MTNLTQTICNNVKDAVACDELDLPTLPEVALRIRNTAQDENLSARNPAAVVAEDPTLSARLIKVANSPMFLAVRSIDDLHTAMGRIGVEYAANLATGLAMQQIFQATTEFVDRKMRSVWSRSRGIAAFTSMMAKNFATLAPDKATLAGLEEYQKTLEEAKGMPI